jgi:hypothetical protein
MRSIGVRIAAMYVAALGIGMMALAFAEGPPTDPIDTDGVPQRQYLTVVMCYGRAECEGICRIENKHDNSSMPCEEWFGRYCPPSSTNATCKALLAEVGSATERD